MNGLFHYRKNFRELPLNRITFLLAAGLFFAMIIFMRLFYLQIVKADYYRQIAFEKNQGYTEIPARRGEILIQDRNSSEPYALATNATFKYVYADPTLIENPQYVGETLAPLLFDLENEQERDEARYETLMAEYRKALEENFGVETTDELITQTETSTETTPAAETSIEEGALSTESATETSAELSGENSLLSYNDLRLHTDAELYTLFKEDLINTLSQKTRSVILLAETLDQATTASLEVAHLTGIEITENGDLYAYPAQIKDKENAAEALAALLGSDADLLENVLAGENRYVVLKRKLNPDVSDEIERLMDDESDAFFGIRMREEYYRYYPEGSLGAQLLGYVNGLGQGQYGMEGSFDSILQGESGYFTSSIDGSGNQITVGDTEIQEAINGSDIMLTIDRSIQAKAEEALAKGVENSNADSGIVIIQDPKTGAILAMAHYPTFDPNNYGDAYDLEQIDISDEEEAALYRVGEGDDERIYLYIRKDPDVRIELFYDAEKDLYYKYKNNVGPEVYQLKAVQLPYEPGSVFKPIAMASAIDAGEVTPYTTFNSSGPVQVDEYTIKTFNDKYYGISTMTDVLVHSDNTGMVFVAYKLGKALFYDYIVAFGFGEKTGIEFEGEHGGTLEYYDYWADSELVTKAFGQGIGVTPIQLVTAISTLANGGILMQPYIVEYIEDGNGNRETFEPQTVRRVITEETSDEITAMMTAVMEQYNDATTKLSTHYIAGKTGTAQTYKYGKALKGVGTTIVSFVGFGPIDDPQFTIVVKMDRPKNSEYAEANAGPVFHEIAEFLVNYYNIPPDK